MSSPGTMEEAIGGLNWMSWNQLTPPNQDGGWDSETQPALTEQCWPNMDGEQCLMIARYALGSSMLNTTNIRPFFEAATRQNSASYIWQSLMKGQTILKLGLR